jgi:hypothetical protein
VFFPLVSRPEAISQHNEYGNYRRSLRAGDRHPCKGIDQVGVLRRYNEDIGATGKTIIQQAPGSRGGLLMKKATIVNFLILSILLVGAIGITFWLSDDKGRDWTLEAKETNCLVQSWANVPLIIPLRSDYEYGDSFQTLFYKFPSWWAHQPIHSGTLIFNTNSNIYQKVAVAGKDVWITYFSQEYRIARYDTQTHDITQYRVPLDKIAFEGVTDLYVTHDGVLWITLSYFNEAHKDYSALARYKPESDSFEIVIDQGGLLDHAYLTTAIPDVNDSSDKHLGELSDGQLVVVLGRNIYLYNPTKNSAHLILDHNKNWEVASISVGPDDNIWSEVFTVFPDKEDFSLKRLNPETGQITDYGIPPQARKKVRAQLELGDATKALAVDRNGSVWISYFDRLEPNPDGGYDWHPIKLPPVFVNTFYPEYTYSWANVYSTHTASDGNIWFGSDIGIVKYDVKNKSWCLSAEVKTLYEYPITEDAEGNIWTVVDGQIYKFTP